jgi:hypothetical protein
VAEPTEREGILAQAAGVASLLGEPRAFLLFLFAVLALFEWSSYEKSARYTEVVLGIMTSLENNRTREMAGQQQLVSDLIDILEYRGDRPGPVQEPVPPRDYIGAAPPVPAPTLPVEPKPLYERPE